MRLLGAVSGAALAVGLLPVTAASAQVTAAGVEDICPAPGQVDAFTDDTLNTFEDRIDCAAAYDLIEGKTATTFDPQGFLTRGQAATILVNYVEVSNCGVELATDATDHFTDVDGNIHEPNIQKAADNGIVNGYDNNTFRPDMLISRAQFATMAVQATEVALGDDLGTDADSDFDDIVGNVHAENIEKAFDNGMLVGTSPRTFSPNQNVTRGQATSIVIGAAGQILFPAGEFCPAEPDPGFETLVVSPAADQTVECVDGLDDDDDADDVTITVAGLSSTEDYRLTLVNADNIDIDDDGFTTFVEDADTGLAAAGMLDARIVSVNNNAPAMVGQSVGGVSPVNGTITFVIECNGAEALVPVVYTDQGGANTRLNIDDVGRPTEPFGIGGTVTFVDAPPPVQGSATVTAEGTVVQGEDVLVTVVADDVLSVVVTGDCIDPQTFLTADDEDATTAGLQFSVLVNGDATVGACELTVVTAFTEASGLTPDTDMVTVGVTSSDVVAATATIAGIAGGGTITVDFSEDVNNAALTVGDFLLNGEALVGATIAPVGPEAEAVFVITLAEPLAGGDVITLLADATFDVAFNDSPAANVVFTVEATVTPPVQGSATVTAGGPGVQGGDVVLTVLGSDVASVAVTGDCIAPQSFLTADDEDVAAGLQFSVAVDADATVGSCVLTVAATFTEASGLTADTDTVTIEVTASDVVAPTFGGAATVGDTTFTFAANEGLECDSFVTADLVVVADTELGVATCDETTDAITIVFDGALDAGEGVTLAAGSVQDLAGNPGPTDPVSINVL